MEQIHLSGIFQAQFLESEHYRFSLHTFHVPFLLGYRKKFNGYVISQLSIILVSHKRKLVNLGASHQSISICLPHNNRINLTLFSIICYFHNSRFQQN